MCVSIPFQVTAMNHKGSSSDEDSPQAVLTRALERAALVNYKQVYSEMEAASKNDCHVTFVVCHMMILTSVSDCHVTALVFFASVSVYHVTSVIMHDVIKVKCILII